LVDLIATEGQAITVNFLGPAKIYLPFVSSTNVELVPYAWIDAKSGGRIIPLGDDAYDYVSLPFTFNVYGNSYTGIYVSSNGFISFEAGSSAFSNSCIPSGSTPNNAAYVFWDDLVPTGGANGNVYVKQIDPSTVVVEWYQVKKSGVTQYETFEAVLRSNHSITYQYQSLGDVGSATIGVENSTGTLAKQFVCNGDGMTVQDRLAIRYPTP